MKLHPVNNTGNKYCGPAALSILTGLGTATTAALIRHVNGRSIVKGAFIRDLRGVLSLLGYTTEYRLREPRKSGPTLAAWLKQRDKSETLLVVVGWHFAVVQGNRYACGNTLVPVATSKAPRRRARVSHVLSVSQVEGFTIAPEVQAVLRGDKQHEKRKVYAAATSWKKKTMTLAQEIGANIEIDQIERNFRHIWVTHPQFDDQDNDPHEGDHIVLDWEEAYRRVVDYQKAREKVQS